MSSNNGYFFELSETDRFDYVVHALKQNLGIVSDADLARSLGIEPKAYAGRKRNASIPFEEVLRVCERKGIQPNKIFSFDPLLMDANSRSLLDNTYNQSVARGATRSTDGNAEAIHVFDAEAACGAGFINDTACVIDTLFIDASLLRQHDVKAEDARIFRSRGDSMVPTVPVGVDVLIDVAKKSTSSGGVFAFRVDDECFIKRLMLDKTANQLHVISDNTTYPKQLFSLNEGLDIEIIGKLKAYIKWF